MSHKVIVDEVENLLNSSGRVTLNENTDKLANEFDKVLYADGSTPLKGNVDADSNRIINLPDAVTPSEPVTLRQSGAFADAVAALNNYYPTKEAGELATAVGQYFTYPDGNGQILYAERLPVGSQIIGEVATQAGIDRIKNDLASPQPGKGAEMVSEGSGLTVQETSDARGKVFAAPADVETNGTSLLADLVANLPAGGSAKIPRGTWLLGEAQEFTQNNITLEFDEGATFKQGDNTQNIDSLLTLSGDGGKIKGLHLDGNRAGNAIYTGRGELLRVTGDRWVLQDIFGTGNQLRADSSHSAIIYVTGDYCTIERFYSTSSGRSAIRNKGDFFRGRDWKILEVQAGGKGFYMDSDGTVKTQAEFENILIQSSETSLEDGFLIDPDGTALGEPAPMGEVRIRNLSVLTPNATDTTGGRGANNVKFAFVRRVVIDGLRSQMGDNSYKTSLRFQQHVTDIELFNINLDGGINFDTSSVSDGRRTMRIGGASRLAGGYAVANVIGDWYGDLVIEDGVEIGDIVGGVGGVSSFVISPESSFDEAATSRAKIGALRIRGASGSPSICPTSGAPYAGPFRFPMGAVEVARPMQTAGTFTVTDTGSWKTNGTNGELFIAEPGQGGMRRFRSPRSSGDFPRDSDGWLVGDFLHVPNSTNGLDYRCTKSGSQALNAWAGNTAYSLHDRVKNGGNVYRCTSAGTSAGSGGPTGTGTGITDGAAEWAYVAPLATFVGVPRITKGSAVSDPAGGSTVDTECRTQLSALIDSLQAAGVIE